METRLERLRDEAMLGGVAAGIARYFNIDRTLVRVLFLIGLFIPHFPAVIVYIILWVVLPERRFGVLQEPILYSNPTFSTMNPYNPSNPDRSQGSLIFGVILIVLGVLFLLDRWFDIDLGDLWPLVLIAVGVWLLFKDRISNRNDPFNRNNDPYNTNNPS
ncbi:PspC domain-containing protein [Rudanella paleaurantiibacter]|uniref:PspC domain-containing protein n=1 Tax=Rudanella paleaurantiibacter TaxID=2614655 RepID=A0A7J5TUN8_9BACT|nr:PspC domain-containing protein [Rudanella paleaurantiibacter]KAB7727872.1 PspC domain-containing protein [Rudanella paleaurantiibacter]